MARVEVEAKFPIDCGALDRIKERLLELGYAYMEDIVERDYYLLHPCRDLVSGDEALRVRVATGNRVKVTYKGPRTGDRVKSRIEVEAISDEAILEIFDKLGFRVGIIVEKQRSYYRLGNDVIVLLDRVKGLGCFVEVESLRGEETRIMGVARELGLDTDRMTTESYAYMLYRISRSHH